jgi:two-component system LytT family response regulator
MSPMPPISLETPRLRAIVVDDEESARDLLCEYLAAHPEVEIVARCVNGFEAVKAVAELAPDLLFLDVQMPKLSGFEVLELLGGREPREATPAVIFITAWDQYAVQAFEVHAVDYLLKPFPPERLAAALARAGERLARGEPPAWEPLARANRQGRYLDRILVREESRIVVLPVERLDYAEARDDSVLLKAGGERHLKPQTLTELEAALDPARFVRVHRSYLLNVERLERLDLYAKDSRVAILVDGTRLPVSRSGYARLKELL